MKRNYKKIEFKPNYKTDKFIMTEMVHFYYNESDYVFGRFHRVMMPKIDVEELNQLKYLTTFVYLNPRLNDNIYHNFYNYCTNKIKNFNIPINEYNYILSNKDKLNYVDCYYNIVKIVYNEEKFANKYKLNIYDRKFLLKLEKSFNGLNKKWIDDSNRELLKDTFFSSMDNIYLSYESLAVEFGLTIQEVKNHLNSYGIHIRKNELEYKQLINKKENGKITGIGKSEKVIIKRQPFEEYLIEKQIKYLLLNTNKLFNINDILDGCKYYSEYYKEVVQIEKDVIKKWINKNPYYMKAIKNHIKNFNDKKLFIIRQNKLLYILNYINKETNLNGERIEYVRNSDGKIIVSNYFGEEFDDNYELGDYKTKYHQNHDIDDELGIEFEF